MSARAGTVADLRALAGQIMAIAELAARESPPSESGSDIDDMVLAGQAARMLAVSRARRALVACDLSGEDYWDIMLALFVARVAEDRLPILRDGPLGSNWTKPATHRWLAILRERGLVGIAGVVSDREGVPVLTATGHQLVRDILSRLGDGIG